ncbi:DNA polymerase III subunit delta [Aurantimicrobium minutum]|uniref:DNA polymerase III subunit delta n=1 Tax=Aurantimicrobium minutum TaxID=708131 RepID=UPI0024767EAD|nr:DNA polymerase III subunit delta [Aurantimicrobium minutum]MDH6536764.1 DNA polymerase-3 subunit delta [Aurantimicrobium minutum]
MAGKAKIAIEQLSWNNAKPAPIVLVSGAEGFLADRATQRIREILRDADASLEVSDLDASSYAPGELLTLASPSLFGEPRLIRVSDVEKSNDEFLVEMLDYAESPDPDTTVVLRHGGGVRGKKLLETLRSGTGGAVEIVCAELKSDNDKFDFAGNEFRIAGRKIAPSALRSLVQAFSGSGSELANACQQLIADADGDITDRTVEDYYGGRIEATAFKVVDSAVAGRLGDALVTLRHALQSGADPVPIVATFAAKLRLMAKLYGERRGSGELAGALGAAPWQIDRARKDLSGWSETGLGNAIEVIAQTDANVKGASRDPIYALERMVNVVASYGRR